MLKKCSFAYSPLFFSFRRPSKRVWTGNVDRSTEKVADTCTQHLMHLIATLSKTGYKYQGHYVRLQSASQVVCGTKTSPTLGWQYAMLYKVTIRSLTDVSRNGHQDGLIIYSRHRNNPKREHKLKWHITTVYSQLAQKEILQVSIIIGQSKS
jgi:hypothetical protein